MNATDISSVVGTWERQYAPKNLLRSEHNLHTLKSAIDAHLKQSGSLSVTDLVNIVNRLGDFDNGGQLQYHKLLHAVPEPANPSEHLPFAEIKTLSFLKTVEDVQKFQARVQRDGLSYMGGFKRLRPNSTKDYEELNARMNYILQNKIYRSDLPESTTAETKPVIQIPPAIADARPLVEAMNLSDIGQTSSEMGRHQMLVNTKRKLHNSINEMYLKRVKHDVILQRTKQAIADSGSSSIR